MHVKKIDIMKWNQREAARPQSCFPIGANDGHKVIQACWSHNRLKCDQNAQSENPTFTTKIPGRESADLQGYIMGYVGWFKYRASTNRRRPAGANPQNPIDLRMKISTRHAECEKSQAIWLCTENYAGLTGLTSPSNELWSMRIQANRQVVCGICWEHLQPHSHVLGCEWYLSRCVLDA